MIRWHSHARGMSLGRALGDMVGVLTAGLLLALVPGPVVADEPETPAELHGHEMTNIWDIGRGGQLYDNWMKVMERDAPAGTHPAYPAEGKQKDAATWRCKECHGWDYKGAAGAYAKGSHFTGIKGVLGVAGRSPDEIHQIIMDKTHALNETLMPHSAMEKLALFLSFGLIDDNLYIDNSTKTARGSVQRGAAFYQTVCAVCHGFDGKAMNFGDDAEPEFVGTIARDNPWEALHKIRFGQPGVGMVSLNVLPIQDLVDILAYAQTLPEK